VRPRGGWRVAYHEEELPHPEIATYVQFVAERLTAGCKKRALPVSEPGRRELGAAWLAGPYCESGDVLIEALPMPDIQPGELVAVPVSGAYQLSMANNYNGACRPAVVWLEGGQARLVVRREAPEELARRDIDSPK
jgi:diaminopimelate decarboxylase